MISDQRRGSWYAGTLYLPAYIAATAAERRNGSPGVLPITFDARLSDLPSSAWTDRRLRLVLQTRLDLPWPNLPAPFITVGSIPVRQPASLPEASFKQPFLDYRCLRLTFSSVRMVMDFVCRKRYIANKHHQLVTGHARHTTIV